MRERKVGLRAVYVVVAAGVATILVAIGAPKPRAERVKSFALFGSPQRFTIPEGAYTSDRVKAMVMLANLSQTETQRVLLSAVKGDNHVPLAEIELSPNQVQLQQFDPLPEDLKNASLQLQALRGDTLQNRNPAPVVASMWLVTLGADSTLESIRGVAARGAPKVRNKDKNQSLFEPGRAIPFTTVPFSSAYLYNQVTLDISRACREKCTSARYYLLVSFDGKIIEKRELNLGLDDSTPVADPIQLASEDAAAIGSGAFTLIPVDEKQAKLSLTLSVIPVPMPGEEGRPALAGASAVPFELPIADVGQTALVTAPRVASQAAVSPSASDSVPTGTPTGMSTPSNPALPAASPTPIDPLPLPLPTLAIPLPRECNSDAQCVDTYGKRAPYCNNGTCVECISNDDCKNKVDFFKMKTPVCHVQWGSCVQCTEDSHCTNQYWTWRHCWKPEHTCWF